MTTFPPVPAPANRPELPLTGGAAYRASLAADLVLDIELNRLPVEPLLYKARRLANILGDVEVEEWLGCELGGYTAEVPVHAMAMAKRVGRDSSAPVNVTLAKKLPEDVAAHLEQERKGRLNYSEGLPRLETAVLPGLDEAASKNAQTAGALRRRATLPGGKVIDPIAWEHAVPRAHLQAITIREIGRRVRAELHRWAASKYHHCAFADVTGSIFERHRRLVDEVLTRAAPEVVEKIPSVYDRLADQEDTEAVSQAMSTTRRMIASFADAIFPAQGTPVIDEAGRPHDVRQADVLNRIQQALNEGCSSKSRVARLAAGVRAIYERVSAGMKTDMAPEEAQSLFLATYLVLGEVAAAIGFPGKVAE